MAFSIKNWWQGVLPSAEKAREKPTLTVENFEDLEKRLSAFVEKGIQLTEAANSKFGVSAAMTAGKVTVANTSVTANSRIFVTRAAGGANPGAVYVSAKTAGTSFEVTSTSTTDTGTVNYLIIEPA